MYKKKEHIHFIGIGGIGMSGIATILRQQGYTISGCDNDLCQQTIKNMVSLGCSIFEGNNSINCMDDTIDIIVYSTAIKPDHPEILRAQKRGIPVIHRAQMLAEIMRTKYSIAITGSHGKTTTSSIIAHILMEAKYDPTIILGGHLTKLGTNAKLGNGNFLVAEADESDRSFIMLQPTISLITNISLEHLETYKDLDDIKETYSRFLEKLPFYGTAFLCIDDQNICEIIPKKNISVITYGTSPTATFFAEQISLFATHSTYVLRNNNNKPQVVTVPIPGIHNVQNSLGALAIAQHIGISQEVAITALKSFAGVDRRFSFRGISKQGAELFDDYGHHPLEIEKTLHIAKQRTKGKLIVAFQPHRFTRTKALWNEFINVFAHAPIDHLILTDIYPASEAAIDGITTEQLKDAIIKKNPLCSIEYIPLDSQFTSLQKALYTNAKKEDLILIQGAGNLYKIIPTLL